MSLLESSLGAIGLQRAGSSPGFDEETRAFLQSRLHMLTGALAIFTTVLLAAFLITNLGAADDKLAAITETLFELPNAMVTALAMIAAGLYRLLHRRRLAEGPLVALDGIFMEVLIFPVLALYAALHTFSFSGFPVVVPFLCFLILTRGVLAIQLWHRGSFAYPGQPYPVEHFTDMLVQNQLLLLGSIAVAAVASRVNLGLRRRTYAAQQLGQYEIHGRIGAGAMGEVYLARHAMLRRPTAVKLLRPDIAGGATLHRFEQEVQQTSRLTHPNTVEIFDYGHTAEGVFYYAMEYLDGADLRDIVEGDGPLPAGRVIHVLSSACGALNEAHAKGIIHRDIKPANVMLCEQGGEHDVVKILDFGLVKDLGAFRHAAAVADPAGDDKRLVGTPETMAPEAIREGGVSRLSDLYSLAVVGYFLLTGRPIFDADTVADFIRHHQVSQPVPPSARVASVPKDLEAVILRCLAKDPGQRPASAQVFRRQLLACADAGSWGPEEARLWWKEWFAGHPRTELQEMAVQFRSGGGSFTSGDTPRSSGERSGARSFGSLERATSPSFVTIDGRLLDELIEEAPREQDDGASITRWETKV